MLFDSVFLKVVILVIIICDMHSNIEKWLIINVNKNTNRCLLAITNVIVCY